MEAKVPPSQGLALIRRGLAPLLLFLLSTMTTLVDVSPFAKSLAPERSDTVRADTKLGSILDDECEPLEDEDDGTELDPIAVPSGRADAQLQLAVNRVLEPDWLSSLVDEFCSKPAWRPLPDTILERAGHFLAVARTLRSWLQSQTC